MLLQILKDFARETLRLFVEISPYLIIGFLFAGLLHTLLGEKYIRKHFARSGIWSTTKAAIFGIPLPVCSCAVIPLAEAMRKDGASKSSAMAFLVSTPSSGIDSIFATYALLGPIYAVFRPIASFLAGIFVGTVTHLVGGKEKEVVHTDEKVNRENGQEQNKKSFRQVFNYGFRVIPSEISKWLIVGVVIGGAISAVVPTDFGTRYLHSPVLNYLMILVISIPIYVCATGSIPIAASLIAKGVMPGAALTFLIAGPATNTVTISFVWKKMGKRVTLIYVLSIVVVAVVTGLIFDLLLIKVGVDVGFITPGEKFLPSSIKLLSAAVMIFILINTRYDLGRWRQKVSEKSFHKIKVPDMTCRHCEMKISEALEALPEVRSVSINLDSKEVAVEAVADRSLILERIRKEGYHPE